MWELHDGAAEHGPHSEEWVVEAIGRRLRATTLVRQVGETEWRGLRSHPPFAMALERLAAAPVPFGAPDPALPTRPAEPSESGIAGAVLLSGVRVVGMLIAIGGVVGMVPGCLVGGGIGVAVAAAAVVIGLVMASVSRVA